MSWKPQDFVAVIFAIVVAASILMASYSISIMGTTISEERKTLLGVAIAGVMSVLIMYMQGKKDKDDE